MTAAATIPDALGQRAISTPHRRAVIEGGKILTYLQLYSEATKVARSLASASVGPGDRVALWAPNSARWITCSFGVYMAGAALVPLNTRFGSAEASHVVRTSESKMVLAAGEFLGQNFAEVAGSWCDIASLERVVDLDDDSWSSWMEEGASVAEQEIDRRVAELDGSSTSDIIFTSGTTGAPKGAVLTHAASVRTYEAWSDCVGLRDSDKYLVVYPLFHTAGLKSGVLACVLKGAEIHPFPVFDVEAVMAHVSEHRITMLPGPPTVFQSILQHPRFGEFDLSSLRLSVTGAAMVPVEVVRRMRDDLHFENVITGYGLTETTGTVSMCRFDDPPEVVANTVGRPLPGVEVKVVDEHGSTRPAGAPGEILVRGFNVMKEYFHDSEATRATIDQDGWLRTGDVGLVDQDGNLRITDRKKDMYISGGFNVYPAEVEGIILRHPAVAQVAVIGLPDDRLGEIGQAVVVPRRDAEWDDDDFLRWCKENMANFKVPRSVRVVDALPINPSGKVMKFRLRGEAGATTS